MKGCKWPIGHPGDEDFYFCGKEVIPESLIAQNIV